MQKDQERYLTEEKLADMRAQAQFMEDELHAQSEEEFAATGKLSSPRLCEKALEYENYLLGIEELEALLREKGR